MELLSLSNLAIYIKKAELLNKITDTKVNKFEVQLQYGKYKGIQFRVQLYFFCKKSCQTKAITLPFLTLDQKGLVKCAPNFD